MSATRGVSARVDTEVAIALAASWNPFVKSNAIAAMTTARTAISAPLTRSRFLDGDGLDGVRHVLERVAGRLQLVGDLLHLQDRERVVLARAKPHEQHPVRPVALVLQPVALDPVLLEVLHGAKARHHG